LLGNLGSSLLHLGNLLLLDPGLLRSHHVHIRHLGHHLLHLHLHLLHLHLLVWHHVWIRILAHATVVLHLHVLHLRLKSLHLPHHLLLVHSLVWRHLLTKLLWHAHICLGSTTIGVHDALKWITCRWLRLLLNRLVHLYGHSHRFETILSRLFWSLGGI
jgi:hypothetical protein